MPQDNPKGIARLLSDLPSQVTAYYFQSEQYHKCKEQICGVGAGGGWIGAARIIFPYKLQNNEKYTI